MRRPMDDISERKPDGLQTKPRDDISIAGQVSLTISANHTIFTEAVNYYVSQLNKGCIIISALETKSAGMTRSANYQQLEIESI